DGQLIQYAYDTANRLTSVTYADGAVRSYVYENPASLDALTGIVDERGNRLETYTYDSLERAVTTERAGGVFKYTIAYGSGGQSSVTDPLGTVRTYTYATASGRQTVSAADKPSPNGTADAASRTQDSATGLVLSETDFLGGVTTFQWLTPRMLPASVTQAYGTPLARTRSTTWHSTLSLPATVTEPGKTTAWTYDAAGHPLTQMVTDTATGQTRTWSWTYNAQQLMATSSAPGQGTTTYTWNAAGQLTKQANALNQETHFDYDAAGRLSQRTDPNGLVAAYAYDARGRLTNATAGTESTTYVWDGAGLLESVTLPDGATWAFTYDEAQRLTQVQDGQGNKVVYTLDAMGNRTKEEARDASDAVVRTRSWVYNSLNRLQDAIEGVAPPAQATTVTYDLNANPTATSAPLGRNSSRTFDVLNRVKQVTDANNGVTKFEYDAQDNLTKVTDPKNLNTTYAYSGFGQLLTQSSPDTGTTTFVYNANGTLQSKTDARGVTTGYTWDVLGRVATITYLDQTITYTYDACTNGVGRVCSVADGTVTTSYTYTQAGRVASKTQTVAGSPAAAPLTVSYAYNSAGELSQVTTPSGSIVGYSYTNGRVTGITAAAAGGGTVNLLSQITYNADGQVQGWQWSDGTARTITYDDAGRIAGFSLGNPAGTGSKAGVVRQLQRDAAGRITGYTHSNSAGAVNALDQSFGYDSLDRLVTATWATGSIGYSYDANGNRTAKTVGGTIYANAIDSQSNKLLSVAHASGTSVVSHDAAGNVTGDGTSTYTYSGRGRMATASPSGLTFAYDWLGQRVRKQSTGASPTSTYYVYDEAGRLIGEYDVSGAPVYETMYLGGTPVGVMRQGAAYNVYADQIGTPRVITAQDQTIVWRWDTAEAFGATAPNQNPSSLGTFTFNQRFPGQVFD
ncbi:RHS repeat protein, partial [Ramlibacter humi]